MASWQSGNVKANGIRVHYTRTGGLAPPLVLAHGVTDNGLCWTPVATALAQDYDVIMVDARGHGQSEAPQNGYDPATQADDVAGVIAALGLHKPAVLGHSMGAATTLVLAGHYPDLPGAILLEDPPGWWVSAVVERPEVSAIYGRDEEADARLNDMRAGFADIKRKTRDQLLAEQRAAAPTWSEAELGPWADSKVQVSEHVLNVLDPATPRSVDWPSILRQITCPALLITADTDRGAVLSEDGAVALQRLVPHIEITHIPGAGHNIRREQFKHFMHVVRSFLAEHAAA